MFNKFFTAIIFSFALIISPAWAKDKHDHNHEHSSHETKVNINKANAETLDKELKYVGEKTAQRIIDYREKNGDFKNVDELSEVRGIGSRIIKANRTRLTTE